MSSLTIPTTSLLSGQGIDVASTVQGLVAAARAPEQNWQNQQSQIQQAEGVVNQINSGLSTLLSTVNALNALKDPKGALESIAATSSDSSLVTATATSSAALANHVVVVNNLASTASYYSATAGLKATDSLGSGSFDLTIGGQKQTIQLNNQNLTQLAQSINAMTVNGKPLGATASVITDSVGAHLVIVANNSGSAGAFTIDDTNDTKLGMRVGSAGADAYATVDGVPVYSANNTISGVIPGVTLQLQGSSSGKEVRIQTQTNTQSITQAVSNFVGAYNSVISELNSQFKVTTGSDGTTIAPPLESDSTVRAVQQQMLSFMSQLYGTVGAATPQGSPLGDVGITMNNDGTLKLDPTLLSTAITSNYSSFQDFFQGTNGFATQLSSQLTVLADPVKGAFYSELKGMKDTYNSLQNNVDNLETYITSQQQMWLQQYTKLNVTLLQWPFQQQMMDTMFGTNTSSKK